MLALLASALGAGCADSDAPPFEPGAAWVEVAIDGDDTSAGDWFGAAVAIDGDLILVGAPAKDALRGASYVFVREGTDVRQVAKLTADDAEPDDGFGSAVAVDAQAGRLVVGAPRADGRVGAAYVFALGDDGWQLEQKLAPDEGIVNEGFGYAVAIEGDRVAVGAPLWHDDTAIRGAAYVFARGADAWTEQQRLAASPVVTDHAFGHAVALDGGRLLASDYGSIFETGTTEAGAAYLFDEGSEGWSQQDRLPPPTGARAELFGWSAALSGETIAVGATWSNATATMGGAVYVLSDSSAAWSDATELTAADAHDFAYLGTSVAVDGTLLVASAEGVEDFGFLSGAAYIFLERDGAWEEIEKLQPSDAAAESMFGRSVAISGDAVVVGAYRAAARGQDAGRAYAFIAARE